MSILNQVLLVLHFIGLGLGLSVSFSNIVMQRVMLAGAPADRPILARFPPAMSVLGRIGLTLLWVTGGMLLYTKWGGFGVLPWQFHAKLTAVVMLTVTVTYIHSLERQIQRGNTAAAAKIATFGKIAFAFAMLAVIFAVLTFD